MPLLLFTGAASSATRRRSWKLPTLFERNGKPGAELNIAAEMMRLALQITARTLFDTEVTPEIHEINDQVNVVMDLYHFLVRMPRAELLLNSPLPQMRRFRAAKKRLDEVVDGMIRARQAEANLDRHGDLLSMLVAARDDQAGGDGLKLDAQQIRDQVLTLFLAGFETVANALAWTWMLLGQNPEAEARLHAELDAVLGGRLPTFEDMPRLEYTAMVLSESMRLYPPAWAMGREVLRGCFDRAVPDAQGNDGVLQPVHCATGSAGGFLIRSGFAPSDLRGRPRRDDHGSRISPSVEAGGSASVSRSRGWRPILTLATIAQRWRVEVVRGQKIELQPKITLRPKNGIRVKVVPRD